MILMVYSHSQTGYKITLEIQYICECDLYNKVIIKTKKSRKIECNEEKCNHIMSYQISVKRFADVEKLKQEILL